MGDQSNVGPNISEVTNFLDTFAPDAKKQIAASDSSLEGILEEVGVGGGLGERLVDGPSREMLTAKAKVLSIALNEAEKQCQGAMRNIQNRISQTHKLRFYAAAFSALGASGIIGMILANENLLALIAAIITLVSNIVALYVDFVVLGEGNAKNDLSDLVMRLTNSSAAAKLHGETLKRLTSVNFQNDEMEDFIKKSNKLFETVTGDLGDAARYTN